MKLIKTPLFVILTLLLLATAVCATDTLTTYITDATRLKTSLISQDPDPVNPGDMVEVRWKIENLGSSSANNVMMKLEPEYPFSLLPGDDGIRDIGGIQGRQIDEEGVIVLYKLRVDEYAIEGDTDLELEYKYNYNKWMKTDDVYTIRVQTIDAALSIESVTTTPEKMAPGNPAKLDITIKNLADSYMTDITFKLDLTFTQYLDYVTTITDTAMYYEALPFAPLNSSTEQRISQIAPGKTATITYDLMTYPDATSRVYKVPIIMTFYDEVEEQYIKNDVIGIVVGDEPEMDVVLESSDVYSKNTAGAISIKFVNRGITDIKFLNVKLQSSEEYEITSADLDYVGNVDSDDYESADFDIFLKEPATDKVKLPISVMYKDSNNNDYSKDVELELKLLSEKERGVEKKSSMGLIIFVVIIIVVGWLLYKRWEKKKKNQGKK
ncbi:COG1361 S-layer family protein [Thermoproteota archaeon]